MRFTELRHQDPRTRTYLGSPSLVRAPDGALVASHDYFGPGCPRNHEAEEHLTSIYRSEDDGATWRSVTHIANAYWSTLFTHRGALWLFGVSQQYGSIVIRRSDDGGFTWTHPADATSGLLFPGGAYRVDPNYHTAPVPVVVHQGRIWRAFEDCRGAAWGGGFHALAVSAPEDADLLLAASWTMSGQLALDHGLVPAGVQAQPVWGWLEGNLVVDPQGRLVDILRLHSWHQGRAALLTMEDDGRLAFDPATGFIPFPGHQTKFTIRRDPVTGLYLSLVNSRCADPRQAERNELCLSVSRDLRAWRLVRTLLADDQGLSEADSIRLTGFQYVDWQFDGDDLIYLVRTAYAGAPNHHDSNRITFHRLRGFRTILSESAS